MVYHSTVRHIYYWCIIYGVTEGSRAAEVNVDRRKLLEEDKDEDAPAAADHPPILLALATRGPAVADTGRRCPPPADKSLVDFLLSRSRYVKHVLRLGGLYDVANPTGA